MTATADAPAAAAPAKPRKPDPNAPARKDLVTQIFSEARAKAAAESRTDTEAIDAAVQRLLRNGADAEGSKFKIGDFADTTVGKKMYWFYKKAWYMERVAECDAQIAGKKPKTEKQIKAKADKVKSSISKLLDEVRSLGIDPKALGLDLDISKLVG